LRLLLEIAITARQIEPIGKSVGAGFALAAVLWVSCTPPGEAGEGRALTAAAQSLLQQADAAYSAGERERAKRLYRAVLASEPNNSRASYQLARL